MKKNISGILFLIVIALAACAQQKKTAATSATAGNGNGYTYIQMHRTACFGKCPNYAIELRSDGTVTYNGYTDTKYTGTYTKKMDAAALKPIFDEAYSYRIDTCQAHYKLFISDIPGINYRYTYKGKENEIRNAHFGPAFLQTLAKTIDTKIGEPGAGWVKKEETKKAD